MLEEMVSNCTAQKIGTRRWSSRCLVTADVGLGILLGELVVHGRDMARALHRPWPVTGQQVSLIWSRVEPILPGWVEPGSAAGHQAAYQVHLGDGRRHVLCFTSGALATQLPPGGASNATSAAAPRPSSSSCIGGCRGART